MFLTTTSNTLLAPKKAQETTLRQCRSKCSKNPLCGAFTHKASVFLCELLAKCDKTVADDKFYSGELLAINPVLVEITSFSFAVLRCV